MSGVVEEAPGQRLGLEPVIMQASQEAEDFQRIWTSVFDTVMNQTRDYTVALSAASDAWQEFATSVSQIRE